MPIPLASAMLLTLNRSVQTFLILQTTRSTKKRKRQHMYASTEPINSLHLMHIKQMTTQLSANKYVLKN